MTTTKPSIETMTYAQVDAEFLDMQLHAQMGEQIDYERYEALKAIRKAHFAGLQKPRYGSCHYCNLPLNRRGECDECGMQVF